MELRFTSTDRNIFKRNKTGRLKKGLYKKQIRNKRNAAGTNEIFDKYIWCIDYPGQFGAIGQGY